MATKKKKKKSAQRARRPSYATGKKVETPEPAPARTTAAAKAAKPAAAGQKGTKPAPTGQKGTKPGTASKGKAAQQQEAVSFNIIRRGSLEMKVYLSLLAVVAVGVLLQAPLALQDANTTYNQLKKQYPVELKKFEEKYKTPAEQKKHPGEKPLMPKKPTFSDFLLYQAAILFLQGALFSALALNVQRRTDLKTTLLDKVGERTATLEDAKDLVVWAVPFAAAVLVLPVIATLARNSVGFIKAADFLKTPAWKFSLAYINIAISNEILFTFMLVTALVWVFTRFHEKLRLEPHWAAIVLATVFSFGYIYLISTAAREARVTSLVMAGAITISLVGVLGYLYWRKGIEYSLLAGVIGFGLYPFIARLIIK
jgi:hypothetical protein